MHKIFVYGTLKTGEPNHHWITDNKNGYSKFLSKAKTLEKYPLIIATKYNIPFLLYSPGIGEYIIGEIYEVDDKMLSNLDILEDHPNFYVREKHPVLMENNHENCTDCWIYFIKTFKNNLLTQPRYSNYSSDGSHNLPYLDRSKRDIDYIVKWQKQNMNK